MLRRGKRFVRTGSIMPLAELQQATVYGKCIAADYNGVYKDKCLTEFMKLKDCYTVCKDQGLGLAL